jgi:hypothetical protein
VADDLDLGRPRTVWPMYLFVGGLVALGLLLSYALLYRYYSSSYDDYHYTPRRGGPGGYTFLVCAAPFVAAAAAWRAIREQLRDDDARTSGTRAERRAAKREKLTPRPAEATSRVFDGDPFRAAPQPPPIVARPAAPTAPDTAPIVAAGDAAPPKLLT